MEKKMLGANTLPLCTLISYRIVDGSLQGQINCKFSGKQDMPMLQDL